jgi:putative transposase
MNGTPAGVPEETMPSTHLSLHYHLVFSTKDRAPIIAADWRADLHRYLGACVATAGGVAQKVGGVADHVHALIGLKATHCLANVLQDIKTATSRWVHKDVGVSQFHWQEGYGAFTVSVSNRSRVSGYIATQEAHHRKRSFEDEYLDLLRRHEIEADARYLW